MRRLLSFAAVALAGCSTAPVTNLMDRVRPSRPGDPDRPVEPTPDRGRIPAPGVVPLGEPIPPRPGRL